MSLAFSTSGRVSFLVTIDPTAIPLSRFANAVFRTEARVSHAHRKSTRAMEAVVWLTPSSVPQFEALCMPLNFRLVSSRELMTQELEVSEEK